LFIKADSQVNVWLARNIAFLDITIINKVLSGGMDFRKFL